ncbi:MAG: hypothetical protein PHT54_00905 [Candidatus Nanoarchaeia archaeon]|nr:hypothetical protein [Candidatus Nanoarchaeia archaeon]
MKLVVDIQNDSLTDLAKAIKLLEKAKYNRENNRPLTEGFEDLGINAPKQAASSSASMSKAAEAAKKQQELMGKIDLSTYFSKG